MTLNQSTSGATTRREASGTSVGPAMRPSKVATKLARIERVTGKRIGGPLRIRSTARRVAPVLASNGMSIGRSLPMRNGAISGLLTSAQGGAGELLGVIAKTQAQHGMKSGKRILRAR